MIFITQLEVVSSHHEDTIKLKLFFLFPFLPFLAQLLKDQKPEHQERNPSCYSYHCQQGQLCHISITYYTQTTTMSSFGKWYDNVKSEDESGDVESGISLPLFGNLPANVPADLGWNNFKSTLESQMPQQILGMNYQQRFKVFCALLILSIVFFGLGFVVGLPMISIRPQKFALSFTFGSLTFMGSFAILRGPEAHLASMFAQDRLPFTMVYIVSMLATLYFTFTAHGVKAYVTVLVSSGMQLVALLWYLVTFLPGGAQGMKVLTSAILTMIKPIVLGCTKCFQNIVMRTFGGS
jgi:hypothetical protein